MGQRITRKKRRLRPRAVMRLALLFAIPLLVIAAVVIIVIAASGGSSGAGGNSSDTSVGSSEASVSSEISLKEPAVSFYENTDDVWNLRLVGPNNPLTGEIDIETASIGYRYAREGMLFDVRAIDALSAMCSAADEDGVQLYVISSYRTYADQSSLYDDEVNEWLAAGYSREEALSRAATEVAAPGTSEHQIGLAVDFNSVEQSFEDTEASAWLIEHAEEYGFVMRYPPEKQEVTGVIYEPWHYRYVGREHAARMNALGMCLEEYLTHIGK